MVWGGLCFLSSDRQLYSIKVLFRSMKQLFQSCLSLWGLVTNWRRLEIISHLFFKHIHIPNVKGVLTKESETTQALCSTSLKRALLQIITQMTAPPLISWATWFIWTNSCTLSFSTFSKYNIVLEWILLKETPLERILILEHHLYMLSSHCTSSLFTILHEINIGLPLRGRWKIQLFLRKGIWLSVYIAKSEVTTYRDSRG